MTVSQQFTHGTLWTHEHTKCGLSTRMTNFCVHELNAIHPHDYQKKPHSATAIKAAKNRIFSHYILALFSRCRFHLRMVTFIHYNDVYSICLLLLLLFFTSVHALNSVDRFASILLLDNFSIYANSHSHSHLYTHSKYKYKYIPHRFRFVTGLG